MALLEGEVLEPLTSSIERIVIFRSSNWNWGWYPWTLEHCGCIRGNSKVKKKIPKACKEGNVHYCAQLIAFDSLRSTHWTQLIALNLADNELAHIRSCKGLVEAWKTLCNIHETRDLSNIFLIRHKFFTYKIKEGDDLLDYINKIDINKKPTVR